MSFSTQASDWEILGLCQIGGAATLGGGVWFFKVRSQTAGVDEMFNLSAGLGGVGGSIGGATLPNLSGQLPYTPITCGQPFSLYDLDGAGGTLLTAGASFVVGYSLLYLGASKFSVGGGLFMNQSCNGWGAGVGASVTWGIGVWTHMR